MVQQLDLTGPSRWFGDHPTPGAPLIKTADRSVENVLMTTVPAGWYPDPSGSQALRWWDGTSWSEHVSRPAAPSLIIAPVASERDLTAQVLMTVPLAVMACLAVVPGIGLVPMTVGGYGLHYAVIEAGLITALVTLLSSWQPQRTPRSQRSRRLGSGLAVALGAVALGLLMAALG